MRIIVRVFARLREELGGGRLVLELPEGSTLGDLLAHVLGEHAGGRIMIAVNNRLVSSEDVARRRLKEGDVVDLMPPASGG